MRSSFIVFLIFLMPMILIGLPQSYGAAEPKVGNHSDNQINPVTQNYTQIIFTSKPVFEPANNAIVSLIVTSVFLGGVTLFLKYIIKHKSGHHKHSFSAIIRAPDGWPSLAYLQFLVWTYVIAFAFMFIYVFRIMSGALDLYSGEFPESLMALMGISAGAAVASRSTDPSTEQKPRTTPEQKPDEDKKYLRSMFYGSGNNITLSRLQMFLWTIMSVIIYIFIFTSVVNNTLVKMSDDNVSTETQINLVRALSVPDIDQVLLVLMGISQVSYLGVKVAERKKKDESPTQ